MKRKYLFIIIVLALLLLMFFRLMSNKRQLNEKKNPPAPKALAIPVKVANVKEQNLDVSITKTGELSPYIEAKVIATASGTITELRFNLGDQVSRGQVLAVLDTKLLALDLQKSESNVAKLKNDVQTYTELLAGKATTREKVNELEQNYRDAINQSAQLRKQIADAKIKAPTDGVISVKAVEQGVFVNAGADIATVINQSQTKVQVTLTEAEVYQVKKGQKVKITTDIFPDKIFEGRVSYISPQADATHSYIAEVMVKGADEVLLRSGTFVYADFSKTTSQMILLIPREALTESIKDASVYALKENIAYRKPIKTGIETGGMIQVTSGLSKGDLVVTSGQINLKDGTRVNISK